MIKKLFKSAKRNAPRIVSLALVAVTMMVLSVVCFASTSGPSIDSSMLEPVLEGAKENIAVIVPVGIGLFVIVMGISFIPIIFKKFKRGA